MCTHAFPPRLWGHSAHSRERALPVEGPEGWLRHERGLTSSLRGANSEDTDLASMCQGHQTSRGQTPSPRGDACLTQCDLSSQEAT